MLTFIRIMLPAPIGIVSGQSTRRSRPGRHIPAADEKERGPRPWQRELDRLARRRGTGPEIGSPSGSEQAPPPPAPLPKGPQWKQGTLTDLKIWWGKATVYRAPDQSALNRFAPAPSRKRNRWQQF